MADLTKVSVPLLDMAGIAEYLNIVSKFITDKDKATDTKNVAGVLAEYIAIADTSKRDPQGNILCDRETIKNSLHLDGHPIEYFLTADKGGTISSGLAKTDKQYGEELINLKDELYQLRQELVKKGVINMYTPYAGFYDTFKSSVPVHLKGVQTLATKDSIGPESQMSVFVDDKFYDSVMPGDHLFIVQEGHSALVKIDTKKPDHETLTFTSGTGFAIKQDAEIYRSHGNVMNGTFAFGEGEMTGIDETISQHSGFDDDTFTMTRKISRRTPGYGYTFRIPNILQRGYLSQVGINVQAMGHPGALRCYIIPEKNVKEFNVYYEKERKGQPLTGLKTPEELIKAKSNVLQVDPAKGKHIAYFSFKDTTIPSNNEYGLVNPDCYPQLEADSITGKVRYCMYIFAEPSSLGETDDYYEIEFLQHGVNNNLSDIQLNNTTYYYNRRTVDDKNQDDYILHTEDEINATDLYYQLTILPAVTRKFTPFPEGMYSARFSEPEPIRATHARLTLRVNREGMYHTDNSGATGTFGPIPDNSAITVKADSTDPNLAVDFSGAENKIIAVGTNMCKLLKADSEKLTIEKGFFLEPGSAVYPIGYEVNLKASLKTWDSTQNSLVTSYTDYFPLKLWSIIPDKWKASSNISDRLIFEADLRDENNRLKEYNQFDFEIYWKKSRASNVLKNGDNALGGAIYDLSMSLDHILDFK